MNRYRKAACAALALAAFAGAAGAKPKLGRTETAMYQGKAPAQAASALLDVAKTQTEDGSWERIAIGRIYYLGGRKPEGEAMFKAVLDGTDKTSDLFRVARVYIEAGEWPKARPLLDRMLTMKEADAGDVMRAARTYAEHKEWSRAKPLFEKFVAMDDFDEKELAEIGAWHLLNGDRAAAESYFDRSLKKDPRSVWATTRMAGAYLGVAPKD
ncbi:MAG TPA: hypothetical protein VFE72_00435 [Lysobacter sp.]|nr:hypothetical protein [Lysobacter sp.]